ncbi:MAG: 3-carboxymuconate cyclase [Pirellulaceae bacterium]|nr:MAG: 3-carboxymuconate cyclase [Pirellulaceae bacterium]
MAKMTNVWILGVVFVTGVSVLSSAAVAQKYDIWLGTSSSKLSRGIYHCQLDAKEGVLSDSRLVAEIVGPGFLALHPRKSHLYAVGQLNGEPCVAAYRIVSTGAEAALELSDQEAIGGGRGTHLSVHPSAKMLITAQYSGGTVATFALEEDGSIAQRTGLIPHEGGSGVVANRQESPHPHWAGFSPDGRYAFVPDLGLDQVVIYRVELDKATVAPHGKADVPPGSGPRHMKFHPNGRWAYVLNELTLTVSLFDYNAEEGTMTMRETVPTVPPEELAKEKFVSASEIRIHPNGKFVYTANRGHDTISVFAIQSDGRLERLQIEPVRGATPRNFNLSPDGHWLVVGGQDSHTLTAFAVDEATGRITYNGSVISTPSPICVLFHQE